MNRVTVRALRAGLRDAERSGAVEGLIGLDTFRMLLDTAESYRAVLARARWLVARVRASADFAAPGGAGGAGGAEEDLFAKVDRMLSGAQEREDRLRALAFSQSQELQALGYERQRLFADLRDLCDDAVECGGVGAAVPVDILRQVVDAVETGE